MEKGLTHYIWTHTKKQQLWILCIVFLSMIPYFMSFDLPKQIVNGPIQGEGFERPGATQLFMRTEVSLPYFGKVTLFPGLELTRFEMLYALSAVFLLLVIVNGLFKLYINTYKGRLGERLLRRIRFELVDRVLRFPPGHFKRLKGAEISSMVKDEVEPLGGFTGDALVQPALLGGQALTALFFIFVQNALLGTLSLVIVLAQGVLIPRLRRRLLVLGRERQLTARELAGRVSEIVEGIHTIHANDTTNLERADIAARLGRIFKIRYDLYQWKFMVKFINNFLASVTPFLFYCIGGYLALTGRLDIGQLVAVISAYKDLPGPLKELIDWDQTRQDVQVKYAQVVEEFKVEGMIDPALHVVNPKLDGPLEGPLAAASLSLVDDSGVRVLDHVSLQIQPGEKAAFVGMGAAGGEYLADAFGRLIWPETGKINIGQADLLELPESITGRRISYASSDTFFFHGSLRDNLLYSLKHAPMVEATYEGESAKQRKWEIREARAAGNPEHDTNSEWIDYQSADTDGPEGLFRRVAEVLDSVALSKDILELALRSTVNPVLHPELAEKIVELRHTLRDKITNEGARNLVVFFEPDAYNPEATVGENLLFGNAVKPELMGRGIGQNPYFRSIVTRTGLAQIMFDMGVEIARNAIELFSDLPPDHPFFQQMTFMTADDIPYYEGLVQKVQGKSLNSVTDEELGSMVRLSFNYIEPRYRFGLLTPEIMAKIVETRMLFYNEMPEDMKDDVERFNPDRYTASASLMDNILFGRVTQRLADAQERVRVIVTGLLSEPGLYEQVLNIGLEFNVGAGGRRLTLPQRQKVNMARVILRHSDFYVFNRPLSALDHRQQEDITRNVLSMLDETRKSSAVIWVLSDPKLASLFDRVVMFEGGKVVDDGAYEALMENSRTFRELI